MAVEEIGDDQEILYRFATIFSFIFEGGCPWLITNDLYHLQSTSTPMPDPHHGKGGM